jgi:hypothetical protein
MNRSARSRLSLLETPLARITNAPIIEATGRRTSAQTRILESIGQRGYAKTANNFEADWCLNQVADDRFRPDGEMRDLPAFWRKGTL